MSTKAMMLAVFILFGMAALSAAGEGEKVSAAKLPKFIRQDPLDFILVARDDYYSPTYVQVKVKHGSVIRIENKGAKAHGLIIPAFRYQGVILPGRSRTIEVPRREAGLYEFYCPYHKNMRGTIEVF